MNTLCWKKFFLRCLAFCLLSFLSSCSSEVSCGGWTGALPTGENVGLNGARLFSVDSYWNQDVSTAPVDSNSNSLVSTLTAHNSDLRIVAGINNGTPVGMPYAVINGVALQAGQAASRSGGLMHIAPDLFLFPLPVTFNIRGSDVGPYVIPANAPVQNGTDEHVLVVDGAQCKLYELYHAQSNGSSWNADSGAVFDLSGDGTRAAGQKSADAAGLPIFPGLVRYDEVNSGKLSHALRFAVSTVRLAYVAPAVHCASSVSDPTNPSYPPLGMRVRLKASVDVSSYPARMQVILNALKKYGMILADGAGEDWQLSGAADSRWNNNELATLNAIHNTDFEVIQMGTVTVAGSSGTCP